MLTSDLNDEIEILGKVFHFRTCLIDQEGISVRSVVLMGDKVVASREMHFSRQEHPADETVRAWMQEQHKRVFEMLVTRVLRYQRREASQGDAASFPAVEPSLPRPASLVPVDCEVTDGAGGTLVGGTLVRKTLVGGTVVPPSASATPELVRALRGRCFFAGFSKMVGPPAALQADEADQRLEDTAQAFDWIIQSPVFAEIRIDEQVRCHLLKNEVDQWLSGNRDPERASRVWSDVLTFRNYLAEVNHRSELVAFDRDTLVWALGRVRRKGMTDDVREQLAWLYGLFPQLNQLLDHPDGVSDTRWIDLLRNALTLTDPRCEDVYED